MQKTKFLNTCFTEEEWLTALMLSRGDTIRTIANKLSVSNRTISRHITALMRKTGTNNRYKAIAVLAKYI
ncbi:MAG: LuxR C-terminal-related transcriptional regulator [Heliobacteriaceae bacterium]|jgi:DNA-binding NarL/FixJ family response regulator|nr:LuxR C-terminal-related transcriptional regulator [Heliobacteriaceae bacterium]